MTLSLNRKTAEMKTLIASFLIVLSSNVFSQTLSSNPTQGIEIEVQTGFKYLGTNQYFSHIHTFYDGPTERLDFVDEQQNIGLSTDFQLGYRFNQKWSAGATAGIIFWYEGFDFIIPRFGGSSSIGLYGTYHFNDRLSVFTSAGIRKIPNQRFGGTVKIAPQIKIGKRQKIAFRVGSEFYYAKRDQEFYSGYFGNDKYPKTSFFVQGEGPSTTIGWVHEASLSFTIGD